MYLHLVTVSTPDMVTVTSVPYLARRMLQCRRMSPRWMPGTGEEAGGWLGGGVGQGESLQGDSVIVYLVIVYYIGIVCLMIVYDSVIQSLC